MVARRLLLPLLLAGIVFSCSKPALAIGRAAEFKVVVSLNVLENGRCVSGTWSQKAQAQVQVVCTSGEFVGIEPIRGKPLTGTHGAAYRYYLGTNALPSGALVTNADPHIGSGTITALRIYNVNGDEGLLEMLVSF
ncbi:MAG: hypothetical protein JWP41_2938 [Ramlibacter sp.]|nr:hypothetical protein [Ramlibacter sp.]